jgi:hypothetical protein
MCDDKELGLAEEIPVIFSDDVEILEDRLTDIIMAMGLPEEQTSAVLRLISDAIEQHHADILDTLEYTMGDDEGEEAEEVEE